MIFIFRSSQIENRRTDPELLTDFDSELADRAVADVSWIARRLEAAYVQTVAYQFDVSVFTRHAHVPGDGPTVDGITADTNRLVLANLASHPGVVCSATDVSRATGIALPTVSKLLKSLGRSGLVTSTRGANGGYRLSRSPHEISAADVIDALEGPVSITECSGADSHCDYEKICSVGSAWQRINVAIRHALEDVTLFDLLRANCPVPSFEFAGMPITLEQKH